MPAVRVRKGTLNCLTEQGSERRSGCSAMFVQIPSSPGPPTSSAECSKRLIEGLVRKAVPIQVLLVLVAIVACLERPGEVQTIPADERPPSHTTAGAQSNAGCEKFTCRSCDDVYVCQTCCRGQFARLRRLKHMDFGGRRYTGVLQ